MNRLLLICLFLLIDFCCVCVADESLSGVFEADLAPLSVRVRYGPVDGVFVSARVGAHVYLEETELSSAALRHRELWLRPGDGGGMQLRSVRRDAGECAGESLPARARGATARVRCRCCRLTCCCAPASLELEWASAEALTLGLRWRTAVRVEC